MQNPTCFYPRVEVDTAPCVAVAQAGGITLTDTIALTELIGSLSGELAPWRQDLAVHDPAKVLLDLALSLALGGTCLADVAVLRAEPGVYGLVASDPTISRTIDALVADAPKVLAAIDRARAGARARACGLAGTETPDHAATAKAPVVIDLDATLVAAHSEKDQASRTPKLGLGFHPLCALLDHGTDPMTGGTG